MAIISCEIAAFFAGAATALGTGVLRIGVLTGALETAGVIFFAIGVVFFGMVKLLHPKGWKSLLLATETSSLNAAVDPAFIKMIGEVQVMGRVKILPPKFPHCDGSGIP
jgi:hypothetical protein